MTWIWSGRCRAMSGPGTDDMMHRNTIEHVATGLLFLLMILSVGLLCYANLTHFTAFMDADVASDVLLAKELAANHFVIPETWRISTESRILYTANLAAFIYPMTDDLNLSMGIACNLYAFLLCAVMALFYRRIGVKGSAFAAAILLPFVITVSVKGALEIYILYAGHYLTVLVTTYLILFLYAGYLRGKRMSGWKSLVILLMALINGLQGMRGFLMVFLPILVTECLRLLICHRKQLRFLAVIGCSAVLSYLAARIVSGGTTDTSRNIRNGIQKMLGEAIPAMRTLFTRDAGTVYHACAVLISLIAAGTILYRFVRIGIDALKGPLEQDGSSGEMIPFWTTLPLAVSGAVMFLAMSFTTSEVASRYLVYLVFAVSAGYALFLQRQSRDGRAISLIPVILCAILSFKYNHKNLIINDASATSAYMRIADWMQENGYEKGYATFDWASTVTVVSNDRVHVRPVNNMTDLEGNKWLANATWYPPYTEQDRPVVYITTDYTDEALRETFSKRGIVPARSQDIDEFHLYVTESDLTIWRD